MVRTATKKRKPKTGVEQYNSASPWLRRLVWLHYLGHLTKSGERQGLSCKEKEEKGGDPPTIGCNKNIFSMNAVKNPSS